ncbi:MAG: bifunctional homocysteine S-methyltransferase/methylenetetrahydrofolate reductase [Thermoanaerobaculaceae bacterium]|nr:bifunctional homocysteine S-methyltransferase/methylenetetrahydrofolate reductase [Thermoanaerobaculaceae bacterium]
MTGGRVEARFDDHVVVADGAMGSELLTMLPGHAHVDLAALEYPREVLDVHLSYLAAGSEVLLTSTFAASRPRLERLRAGDQVEAVNQAAVKLAREAREVAGVDALVAGSIGPLAGVIDMDDPAGRAAVAAAHAEQAAVLAGRGADLLVLETFFRLDEVELAIAAVRGVCDLPLVASLTFPDESQPDSVAANAERVRRLLELDILAGGINCAPGPHATLEVLEALGEAPGRLAVRPNAGALVRRAGRLIPPPATPTYLAAFARRAASLGAHLVGGCCGTGPEHIRAMAEAVRGLRPGRHARPQVSVTQRPRPQAPPMAARSSLAARLAAGEFVHIVQLDPPKGTNADRIVAATRRLAAEARVDAFDVNSNPLARLRMDSLWLAAEIQRSSGVEAIPHITPRDASLMGLQSQLLGAWRSGLRNLLAISGDPSQLGDYPGVHDVYHVDVFELVRALSRMAEGVDCADNPIGEPPAFCLGVAVNPGAEDLDAEVARLRRKAEAGAHFAMSQVFFGWEPWDRLVDRCGGSLPLPAIVAVWPLTSLKLALRLHNEVPGICIPDDLLRRLEAAGPEAARVGAEVARRLAAEAPARVAGAYYVAPFRNPEEILPFLPPAFPTPPPG